MILRIDTADPQIARLSLVSNSSTFRHEFASENLSEKLIFEIRKFLKKQRIVLKDIKKIEAAAGPGPFSKVRTGVAVANALAFGLGIKHRIIKPFYGKSPNITKPGK